MNRLKLLYEDLKPDKKLGEIALEALRRAPLVRTKTIIATLFEAKFNLDDTMEILNKFLKIVLKSKFYGLDPVEKAAGLGIDWEEVLKIKSLFPKRVENLWVYDAHRETGGIKHYREVLTHLRKRYGDDTRRLVKQIIRKCDVFKVRNDLYVVCVLFLCVGWKAYIVKGGKLVRESKIAIIGDHMENWDIWPYYLTFTTEFHELPKINYGVLKTWCRFPCDLLIVDKFSKGLVAEKRGDKVLICTMTPEAGWEAVEYAKTIRGDESVRKIFWWNAPEVWECWYGLEEKPDLEERYSTFKNAVDRIVRNYVKAEKDGVPLYPVEFSEALNSSLNDRLRADWASKVFGQGHLIIKSDGFDARHTLELYFRVNERTKWLEELDKFSRKYMLRKNLRKEYIIFK